MSVVGPLTQQPESFTNKAFLVAEWQPATVSQVCLAEGTTVYIKYEDMLSVMLRETPFYHLWTENHAKVSVARFVSVLTLLACAAIMMTYRCNDDIARYDTGQPSCWRSLSLQ